MAIINLPEISTGVVVKVSSEYIVKMLRAGVDCRDIRPMIFFGPTGVGKSAAVIQIAEVVEKELERTVKVEDIRLTSCTITDLIGIPSANAERTKTVWLRPEIYGDEENTEEGDVHIAFFDELDKASPAVQAAALQLILDRKAWTHRFPKNTIVIAAANPARGTSKYETRLSPELLNRFKQFNVQANYDSFRDWAIVNKVHPYVLGFLSYDNTKLYSDSESEATAFPTPRSWKSVSDLLTAYGVGKDSDISIDDLHFDISADLGVGTSLEFEAWCSVYAFLPVTSDIFSGKETKLPQTPDVLHAMIASMTSYIESHIKDISIIELRNACRYAYRFPVDFAALFYRNIKEIDGMNLKLMMVEEYRLWCEKHPDLTGR